MATLRPFAALRPTPQRCERIASVPYDVVSTEEARQLAAGNPWSFLHVTRPEIDMPESTDPHSARVYEAGRRRLEALRREALLVQDEERSLYLYRLSAEGHEQTGIAGIWSLAEYDGGVIRRHEVTRPDKEDDRTRHMLAVGAQTGTVFLTYRGSAAIDETVEAEVRRAPLYDFRSEDGVGHTVWKVTPQSLPPLVRAFESIPAIYIADGHHRVASAARARDERLREAAGAGSAARAAAGDEEFRFFLAVAFPVRQVRILPYNRVVKDLGGLTPERFLAAVRARVPVRDTASPSPGRPGEVSLFLAGRWYGLTLPPPGPEVSARGLDVARLQQLVIEPVLGIRDVRTDPRIDFIGGGRGTAHLEDLVATGEAAAAFSLHAVALEELMAVSDAGEMMPPKSTWFEPKLRDGPLVHLI